MITVDLDHPEYIHIPYKGEAPNDQHVALVPARTPDAFPDKTAPDWRAAEFVTTPTKEIRALIGAAPHTYQPGTYAIKVRYTLGQERPARWAGWIKLR